MTVIPDKEARCRRIEGLIAEGRGVVEACREVGGISERTFARWRRAKSAPPSLPSATLSPKRSRC